jgi:L-asparaginase
MTVALVSTGGTIAMVGRHPYDWVDYAESGIIRPPADIVQSLRDFLPDVAVELVPFRALASTGITVADWCVLTNLVRTLAGRADVSGIVVTHGTATLEETAWFLQLTVATEKPIVLVGAQRPPNTAGSDAGPNLRAALLAANNDALRNLGVLVCMDNRIFDARSVTKLSNHDLDAFGNPDGGALGRVLTDGHISLHHRPAATPHRPWHVDEHTILPRVDVTFSYAGSDGVAVQAFRDAGARGIVCAGLPPGRPANQEREALREAARAGVAVVLASRAVRGPVEPASDAGRDAFLHAGDIGPLKTRILLMLSLSVTGDLPALQRFLDTF